MPISLYEKSIMIILFHYMVPALVIYVIFRLSKIDRFLKFNKAITIIFSTAIILYIIYFTIRLLADTIPQSGLSHIVRIMSPLILSPAQFLLFIGLVWLIYRSFQVSLQSKEWLPISQKEKYTLFTLGLLPFLFLLSMLILPEGSLHQVYMTRYIFDDRCKSAKESILDYPKNVEAVFLESLGDNIYQDINSNNEYYGFQGTTGNGLAILNSGIVPRIETSNFIDKNSTKKYLYYDSNTTHKGPKRTNTLKSNYGVYWTNISDEESKKYDVYGKKIIIVDLKNNRIIASSTYFHTLRLRKICGYHEGKNFSGQDFVKRVFILSNKVK